MLSVDKIIFTVEAPDNVDDAALDAQFSSCEKLREYLETCLTSYLNSHPFPEGWKAEVDNEL